MHQKNPSASFAALLVALVLTAPLGGALSPRSVGEIFVDAAGRASGANLATSIDEADGVLRGFSHPARGSEVFETIRIDGFSGVEKLAGAGSSSLTLRGSNAVVTLHDDLHSVLKVHTTAATTVTYRLAPGLTAAPVASPSGASSAILTISDPQGGTVGALVAYGLAGPDARGELVQVEGPDIVAQTQPGTQLVFLSGADDAILRALAEGSLASRYVTELSGSTIRTSQLDTGGRAVARTKTDSSGVVSTALSGLSSASSAALLAYDLAYETFPATSAEDVALFVDGELAPRANDALAVLAAGRAGVAAYHATLESGRARILAAVPSAPTPSGEHRVTIAVGASVATEQQARAESAGDDDARVYGSFDHHPNGKLAGEFLTAVLPEGRAELLSFTSLASRTEVFRSISIDGAADARFRTDGRDTMTIETAKAELSLIDDVLATARLVARAPSEAVYQLAAGVTARAEGASIVRLQGPHGPVGALILSDPRGESTLTIDAGGSIAVRLVPGASLLYRGAPDEHESEDAVLRGLAEGAFGAQVLVGMQAGEVATRTYSYSNDVDARARTEGAGLLVEFLAATHDAPRALLVDARGAALAVKSAADVRVQVDGVEALPVFTPEEALDVAGAPRYYAATSLDGALRIIVNTASVTDRLVPVTIESAVEERAERDARTDAFGAFRLYHDGTAVGDYVTLKVDTTVGAVSGFTLLATREPVFTSLVAGSTPYLAVSGDGTSVLKLENREARLELSDTTAGFARILALADTSAAFHLASGVSALPRGVGVVELVRTSGEHLGTLVLISTNAGSVLEARSAREIRATLAEGDELAFRAHTGIESELSAAQRTMISAAIAAGRVAGTVILQTQASISADLYAFESTAEGEAASVATTTREAYGELTSSVTATYGDLQVVTAATRARIDVTVASATEVGKTLILSLDPETIPGLARGKASIRFDGSAIAQASSYADILDPNDDAQRDCVASASSADACGQGAAEYFVLAGDAGTQVLVSIPSFSVHTVTLEETRDHPNSLYMYATIVLGILVAVQGGMLVRSRLKNKTVNTRRS